MDSFLPLFFVPTLLLAIEHCCKEKEVGGVTYTLVKSDGAAHIEHGCLNDCIYRTENTDHLFCFAPGSKLSKCLEASDHFNALKKEAVLASNVTEKLVYDKTEEHQAFFNHEDKCPWNLPKQME